jgi:bacterioferritin-associated ferredoxin
MYVCLCHGFTDGDVRAAATAGRLTVSDLYRTLDVRPTCGKCVATVRDLIRAPEPGLTPVPAHP